jgi:hypothetical protein
VKNFFFLLLVIFLPTQLGIHFWPEWALVNGIRVDYFSPTLYFTDVLILLLLVWQIFNSKFEIRNQFSNLKFPRRNYQAFFRDKQISNWQGAVYLAVVLFSAGFVYLNISHSLSPAVSAYKWIKILEFGVLGYIIAKRLKINDSRFRTTSLVLIPIFYESVLSVWQFWVQSSVGRWWYFLGERTFNSSTPGIANTFFNGQLLMRSYGTFPHPNVLGAFLAIFLPIVLARFLHNSRIFTERKKFEMMATLASLGVGYGALFLSMSRVAIFVGIVASLVVVLPHLKRLRLMGLICLIGLTGGVYLFWPRISALKLETEPIVVRQQLNKLAIERFAHSPVLGTGLGTSPLYEGTSNFKFQILNYSLVHQPTHNVYLMTLAETGIIGFGLLGTLGILGVVRVYRQKNWVLLTSLLSIAFLGMFDHYFLTLQQGQLIFSLILGMCLSAKESVSRV